MRTKIAAIAVAAGLVVSAAACSQKTMEPWNDARISHKDDSPAEVYSMPDGFNNVASKCDGHGHRFFTTYHGDATYGGVTVIADPTCQR